MLNLEAIRHLADQVIKAAKAPGPDLVKEQRTWEGVKSGFRIGSDAANLSPDPSIGRQELAELFRLRAELGQRALGIISPPDQEDSR